MRSFQAVIRDHELSKYLQLLPLSDSDDLSDHINAAPFSFRLPESSSLRDVLATYLENLCFRLAVQGAFAILTDGVTPYFLAGTFRFQSGEDGETNESASWLGTADGDLEQWLWILQQTISVDMSPALPKEKVFSIPALTEHTRSSKLSSVGHAPHLSFYAGTPIVSKQGVSIGAVFVVGTSVREGLSSEDARRIRLTAEKCMDQLESVRESALEHRWRRMNEHLIRFAGSRAIRAQLLEEPTSLSRADQQQRREVEIEDVQALALRHGHDPSKAEHVALPENEFSLGAESERVQRAQLDTAERTVREDETHQARSMTAQANQDTKHGDDRGESAYRKIFRRAAECLQDGLQVDGVIFADGLVGYHGIVQPTAEAEEEIEREIVQRPHRERFPEEIIGDDPFSPRDGSPTADAPLHQEEHGVGFQRAGSRRYTSAEYLRGIYVKRPAEILGMAMRNPGVAPEFKSLNETTTGLAKVDEGHLQRLMNSYPHGNVWYVDNTTGISYSIRDDTLVKEKPLEEMRCLISCFQGSHQIIFQPLTDPVSLKRLAGCLAWSTRPFPVFTDTTDLPSLRGFLHVLESEVSRIDASAAAKQQEAFVSSVSHELRTPLHGILGSVQLLADTNLDPFQTGLADTIKSSGSTLNETLTSVLSYAKINQFERQQHKYRERRPPDTDWSLPNKKHLPPGPDTDYRGLYICTNIAMLCEEIAGVLEAGQSYDKQADQDEVAVVVEIDYQPNWNYFTEPGALRRIATNIVGNALKYTTEGSVTITLTISQFHSEDTKIGGDNHSRRMVTFTVKDTGKGISKDFMDNHLFVPFTQEDTTSSNGVGLGMSIVKNLVSLLSGEITVSSVLGKGTEVTVMVPMRLCDSEEGETDNPALEFAQCTAALRKERLSVVLFGFKSVVRGALEKHLRHWFQCSILESSDHADPDIVIIEDGNEEAISHVEKAAQRYAQRGALLSIAMELDTLSKPMRPIKGYRKWERIPRPIGPRNLGKGLSSCVLKLRELQKHGDSDKNRASDHGEAIYRKVARESREDDQVVAKAGPNPSREQALEYAVHGQANNRVVDHCGSSSDTSTKTPREKPPAVGSTSGSTSEDSNMDSSELRVLVVEDNAVNRKLLGTFLKKNGCRNVQHAENGALAVKMVEGHPESFDLIFMDMSMPVMDGFKATREIRRLEQERLSSSEPMSSAYVVALTGLASDYEEEKAFEAGVNMFVTKPVQFDKLKKLLKEQEDSLNAKRRATV